MEEIRDIIIEINKSNENINKKLLELRRSSLISKQLATCCALLTANVVIYLFIFIELLNSVK